ncbi:MAG: lamin tail domain-containing protein [Flavobacteriales bacterium]|nr:lamin tail domain-containing protein [Flavobacteriales bacterium]
MAAVASAQATDLIISEYLEGSSNNKYIEIYNGTAAGINLANYQLRLYANGSGTVTTTGAPAMTGTLAAGATVVYKNSLAALAVPGEITNSAVAFNGDDAIDLYNTVTTSTVDIIGNIGCDPGTQWTGTGGRLP